MSACRLSAAAVSSVERVPAAWSAYEKPTPAGASRYSVCANCATGGRASEVCVVVALGLEPDGRRTAHLVDGVVVEGERRAARRRPQRAALLQRALEARAAGACVASGETTFVLDD